VEKAADWLRKKGMASAGKKASRIAAEGAVSQYIHMGSRMGVILEVNCETDFVARGDVFKGLVADLAMQIAACPTVTAVSVEDVDPEFLAKEREIELGKEDLKSKPENIREKMVEGRMAKLAREMALLEQPFVKDPTKTVGDVVKEAIAATGENIKVRRFDKFVLGEGLEKREDDFAAEVAAQTQMKAPAPAPPKEEKAEEKAEEKPKVAISAKDVSALRKVSGAGMMDCKKALQENGGDVDAAAEWLRKKGLASADKKAGRIAAEGAVGSYIHPGSRLGVLIEVNCETDFVARGDAFKELVADLAMQVAACESVTVVAPEDVDPAFLAQERAIEMGKEDLQSKPENIREKIVEGRMAKRVNEVALLEQPFIKDTDQTVGEVVKAAVAKIGENIKVRRFVKYNLGEGLEKRTEDFAAEVAAATGQVAEPKAEVKTEVEAPEPKAEAEPEVAEAESTQAESSAEAKAPEASVAVEEKEETVAAPPAPKISAKDVQALRKQSGAGMMDCKKALIENDGDVEKAADWLRKKGMASAGKKASRIAAEGAVSQYIHMGSRMGVILEVNCETDFVARGDVFKGLVADLAMQIAACPTVTAVSVEDVDPEFLAKEREIELGKEDLKSKPENIREKMVEGRMAKLAREMALLEQPFVKDPTKTVGDVVKEAIAATGENIKVRRFDKFVLGEGLEKREDDFAAEVAAQTQMKAPAPAPPKEEKAEEKAEEKPKVAISAKDVSALRKVSGAGMMDCKKALQENGGDVDAAAEWLRKKGLASADKKAGRIAAEGAVGSYIHPGSRLGVLIEVNCETDFVARGDAFKELVADLAMQVAACESVTVVAPEDVDPAFLAQERAIEMGKEDLQSKPENIREKIVEGRMAKRVNEVALLEQPFIKDTDQTVGEVVKAAVAKIGENIKVRRFVKYNLGEGLEKRTEDFAAEVAAATGQVAEPKAEVKTEVEAPEPKAEAAPVAEPEVEAPQTSAEVEAEVAEPVAEPEVAEAEDAQAKSSAEVKGAEASVAVEQAEEKAAAPAAKTAPVRQESALKKAAAELSEGQAPQTSMGLAFQAAFQKTRKQ